MTSSIALVCRVDLQTVGQQLNTAHLHLAVKLNNQLIWESDITEPQDLNLPLDDSVDGTDNILTFEMSGKTFEHTKVDDNNNIIHDTSIAISNVSIDDIELTQVFTDQCVYHHDFNGSREYAQHKFYGIMGCNGRLELSYSSPFYLWLLENM